MSSIIFRRATVSDAQAILDVYAPYITDSIVTFEYVVPSLKEFTERIIHISSDYPYFVCEKDGDIVGYAYAHRHMERAAYQWNAELSVYIKEEYTHKGIGKSMCTTLIEILRLQGIRHVYSCVTIPNEKSWQLHQTLGFEQLGIFPQSGYKHGAWRSIAWFGKVIIPLEADPKPFCSIRLVPENEIEKILKEGAEIISAQIEECNL